MFKFKSQSFPCLLCLWLFPLLPVVVVVVVVVAALAPFAALMRHEKNKNGQQENIKVLLGLLLLWVVSLFFK